MYWETDAPRDGFRYVDQWGPEHEADKAIAYLREAKGPFAMVVSMNPPHTGYKLVPERYKKRYAGLDPTTLASGDYPPTGTPMGDHFRENIGPGCYGDTVGLLGAGAISQKLQELLTNFELNVIVMASRPERRTVSMEEVFRKAFVVSNHLPNRIDNQNVIREEHFLSMRKGAAFINTGRGAQVDEEGMTAALKKRPDLTALLDVAATEPLRADSELYRLPNVRLSGHIAGSFNDEVIRMADYVIGDFRRMRNGETPLHRISEEMLMTH